eukprot:1157929-Pelagomonas_calceolata.AAC.5
MPPDGRPTLLPVGRLLPVRAPALLLRCCAATYTGAKHTRLAHTRTHISPASAASVCAGTAAAVLRSHVHRRKCTHARFARTHAHILAWRLLPVCAPALLLRCCTATYTGASTHARSPTNAGTHTYMHVNRKPAAGMCAGTAAVVLHGYIHRSRGK